MHTYGYHRAAKMLEAKKTAFCPISSTQAAAVI